VRELVRGPLVLGASVDDPLDQGLEIGVVGGAGGWGREVAARGYANDAGVTVALVAGDAARDAGETLTGAPTTVLGRHWARQAGPASAVLHEVAPRGWYVDLGGVTRIGQRAAVSYAGGAAVTREDTAAGLVELSPEQGEDMAGLVPGVVVGGALPATDVEWALDGGRLTVRVYSGRRTTRRLDALARIVEAVDPRRRFRAPHEYRVVSQVGERLNLQAVRSGDGVPDLARVPVRPGMAGLKAACTPGSLVLVAFAAGDPARPNVVAHDAPDAPGWAPSVLTLQGSGDRVALASEVDARFGDVKSWLASHTHTSAAPGSPTTPPVPPLLWPLPIEPASVASEKVEVE